LTVSALRLYLRFVAISVKSQMQYRASFLLMTLGQFLVTGIEFIAIWALFDRFGGVKGWTLAEVGLFYGIVHVAFALCESIFRGFDIFPGLIKSGDFDKLLMRPRSTVLQVIGLECQVMRLGRLLQGLAVLIWATQQIEIAWTPAKLGLLLVAIAGGAFLFSGIFVLQATLAFWTTESLEIINTVTYGGVETAQFPLNIYRPWFRAFFTFVIPLATINYFPAHAILERLEPTGSPAIFQWGAPLIGFVFFLLTLQVWQLGVRHYRSTGS
jgi:ABC-2 type transport system permease protein